MSNRMAHLLREIQGLDPRERAELLEHLAKTALPEIEEGTATALWSGLRGTGRGLSYAADAQEWVSAERAKSDRSIL